MKMFTGLLLGVLALSGCAERRPTFPDAKTLEIARICPNILQRGATSFLVIDGAIFPFHDGQRGAVVPNYSTFLEEALYPCRAYRNNSSICSPGQTQNLDGSPCEFQYPYDRP
jgi:hypothetical protein